MTDIDLIILIGAIVLGSASTIYSYISIKSSIKENKEYLQNRFWGILFLSLGFIIHSLAFLFIPVILGGLESLAHVVVFVSFIFFIKASRKILEKAKEY